MHIKYLAAHKAPGLVRANADAVVRAMAALGQGSTWTLEERASNILFEYHYTHGTIANDDARLCL